MAKKIIKQRGRPKKIETPKKVAPKKVEQIIEENDDEDIMEDETGDILYEDISQEDESVFVENFIESKQPEALEDLEDLLKSHTFSTEDKNPVLTESDSETQKQLEDLREIQEKEKEVRKNGGRMVYYPSESLQTKKETKEHSQKRLINLLMSDEGLTYLEARAKVEELSAKNISLEKTIDELGLRKKEELKRKENLEKKITPKQGIQTSEVKRQIKYY